MEKVNPMKKFTKIPKKNIRFTFYKEF